MADITHNDPVVTESKLTEFYNDIKPFLGCPAYLTSEGNAEYYSTNEKVIGRWIDGKPIYQKVVPITLPVGASSTGGTAVIAHGISNFGELVNMEIHWFDSADNRWYVKDRSYAGSNLTYSLLSEGTSVGDTYIYICNGPNPTIDWSERTSNAYAILKYTKTTDSATTTIQEDPNEYSTTEKIVGKWIDGKPIYQKTATGTLDSTGFDNSIIITNVDEVIDIKGIVNQLSGMGGINKIPLNFINLTGEYHTGAFFRKRTNSIDIECTSQYAGLDYVVTIQYTKTTD